MDRHRHQLCPALDPVEARCHHKEVKENGLATLPVDDHEAAGAEAGERALDRE